MLTAADLILKHYMEKKLAMQLPSDADLSRLGKEFSEIETAQFTELVRLAPDKNYYLLREITVIPNFWSFIYVRNLDIGFSALGFLDTLISPRVKKTFLRFLQLLAVCAAVFYFFYIKMQYALPFSLIISGGLGNSINRLYSGYVIDFIKWYIPSSRIALFNPWPIFNLADSLIVIGSAILLFNVLTEKKNEFQRDSK